MELHVVEWIILQDEFGEGKGTASALLDKPNAGLELRQRHVHIYPSSLSSHFHIRTLEISEESGPEVTRERFESEDE